MFGLSGFRRIKCLGAAHTLKLISDLMVVQNIVPTDFLAAARCSLLIKGGNSYTREG